MALASTIEGRHLYGAGGEPLGRVTRLLFHPSEARVIGAMVRPTAAMVVVARPETFLPLPDLRFIDEGTLTELVKLPRRRKAAEKLGFDPDVTVIWMDMPVRGPSSRGVGVVSDVEFDPRSGLVDRIEVATGVVADVAHGRFIVPAAQVRGYAEGAVRIDAEAGELESSGGFAKAAAGTLVAASATAAAIGESVGDAVVGASGAAGRAIRTVSDAKVTQKTVKRAKDTWRATTKAFRDGMSDGT